MITVDTGAVVAYVIWFVWLVGTALPLSVLAIDTLINGRPVPPVVNRPEVTVASA